MACSDPSSYAGVRGNDHCILGIPDLLKIMGKTVACEDGLL